MKQPKGYSSGFNSNDYGKLKIVSPLILSLVSSYSLHTSSKYPIIFDVLDLKSFLTTEITMMLTHTRTLTHTEQSTTHHRPGRRRRQRGGGSRTCGSVILPKRGSGSLKKDMGLLEIPTMPLCFSSDCVIHHGFLRFDHKSRGRTICDPYKLPKSSTYIFAASAYNVASL